MPTTRSAWTIWMASACAVGLMACGDDTTGATVVVYSELPAGSFETVSVRVARGTEIPLERMAAIGPADLDFPLRVPLVYEAGALGPVVVAVEARGAGGLVVTGGADAFYFELGDTLTIPVTLSLACRDVVCSHGERCVDGTCVMVDPPDPDAGVGDDDGGVDLGPVIPPDLGPPGVCDPTAAECYCALDACTVDDDKCDCEGGCLCDLTCSAGQDCDHLHCKDAATECTVAARGGGQVDVDCDGARCPVVDVRDTTDTKVKCHKDSCCLVDCSGADNCEVSCESGSYCTLNCAGATDCGFSGCWADEGSIDCGGIRICGVESCPPDLGCREATAEAD